MHSDGIRLAMSGDTGWILWRGSIASHQEGNIMQLTEPAGTIDFTSLRISAVINGSIQNTTALLAQYY